MARGFWTLVCVALAVATTPVESKHSFASPIDATCPPRGPAVPAPIYVVDLGADPKTRWNHVVADYKDKMQPIIDYIDSIYPVEIQELLNPLIASIDDYFPAPYGDELKGIAQQSGIDLALVVLLNIIYDLTAFCTSMVAETATGQILHARNLDYNIPGLQNITIEVDFQLNKKTAYRTTTFAGYVGVLSGMRPNGWSLTVNERDIGSPLDNMAELLTGAEPLGFFLRDVLGKEASYTGALSAVQHARLAAGVYLTMAGVSSGQAAVVTRDRESPADVWPISAPSLWFLVQTNDDHWLAPTDDRRDAANKLMGRYDMKSINTTNMYGVLSTPPVFATSCVYTTLMVPATNSYQSFIRYDNPTVCAP